MTFVAFGFADIEKYIVRIFLYDVKLQYMQEEAKVKVWFNQAVQFT